VTDQLNIFGGAVPLASAPRVRGSDPATSRAAALAVDLPRQCRRALHALWTEGRSPFTDGDLAGWMQEDRNIAARRRKDLEQVGLVEAVVDGGQPAERMGRRGRNELLWQLTDRGRTVALTIDEEVL
jgi:predicted ArsR family transcriptional regulator